MIAIDTNIVVRLLTGDDDSQYRKALSLFNKYQIFITDTVILETESVLRYAYDFKPDAIRNAFTRLFGLPNVHLNNPALIAQAIHWHEQGLDFIDALHLSQSLECKRFYTFDKKLIKQAAKLEGCKVSAP